jgi:membrane associated rhomboid family serine protease
MLIHPLGVEGQPGLRGAWCSWALVALLALSFALEHLAVWSVTHQGPLPMDASLFLVSRVADARISQDASLFEPWQPWTQVLMQEGYWQLLAALPVLLVLAAALEADLGWAAMLSGCLAIMPVSALGAVAYLGEPGAGGLICGLFSMLLARRPRARVPWVLSYYAVLEVGRLRLGSTPVWLLGALFVIQDLLRCLLHHQPPPLLSWALAGVVGAALGFSSRWIRPLPS